MAQISYYAVTFYDGNFYYFGGFNSGALDSILCLNADSWTWSNVGKLNSARFGHGVILVDNKFMVIGGESLTQNTLPNEACVFTDGQLSCTEQSTSLTNYKSTPLFLVNHSYGDC